MSLEDRIKKLEAQSAYLTRQNKRTQEAIKAAAGQLAKIPTGASLQTVTEAIKAAAGQLLGTLKDGDR